MMDAMPQQSTLPTAPSANSTPAAADPPPQQLTSTTAPGQVFASRAALAAHYKSSYHKYNLKRREAGLPVLLEADFEARLAAAQAVRQDRDPSSKGGGTGTGHLKSGKVVKAKRSKYINNNNNTDTDSHAAATTDADNVDGVDNSNIAMMEPVEINPRQCLFDRHCSATVQGNVDRMHRKYGFFLPDREYLTDQEGLIGYCHETIKLGHLCVYCYRTFNSVAACQKHMISTGHTKLRYEAGIDLEDLDVFYDFSEADQEFLNNYRTAAVEDEDEEIMEGEDDNDNDGWEDISDDEEVADDDNDDDAMDEDEEDMYAGYEEEVARMGFGVSALGELIMPDGRIIGHRGLRRYYKQRLPQHAATSTAVAAARQAAGERLYRGRVYNIGNGGDENGARIEGNALALARAGIAPGMAGGGKGILVKSGGAYNQVSIYRYRAAIRKQRKGMIQEQRLAERTLGKNTNRMDKKANRLMNNVSVAHAKR